MWLRLSSFLNGTGDCLSPMPGPLGNCLATALVRLMAWNTWHEVFFPFALCPITLTVVTLIVSGFFSCHPLLIFWRTWWGYIRHILYPSLYHRETVTISMILQLIFARLWPTKVFIRHSWSSIGSSEDMVVGKGAHQWWHFVIILSLDFATEVIDNLITTWYLDKWRKSNLAMQSSPHSSTP